MKHYLDAEGGCDGPSETQFAGLAHSEWRPSKHPCNFPFR